MAIASVMGFLLLDVVRGNLTTLRRSTFPDLWSGAERVLPDADTVGRTLWAMTSRAYQPYSRPITLDSLDDLFAHQRAQFGGMRMDGTSATTDPDATSTTDAAATGTGDTGTQTTDSTSTDTGTTTDTPKFTQAELDKFLGERLAKERSKYEQQLKELQETAGKTELEKLTAERDRYKTQAETGGQTAAVKLAAAEAKVAAFGLKARPDRVAQIIKQADLSEAVVDGEVDEAKVKAAVEKVLTDFPEWKATPGRSGTELDGGGDKSKPTFTRQQIKDMSPEERARRVDELNAAMAEGRITG